MNALFSERNQEWRPVPFWVDFLIRLGYRWPASTMGPRRIALLSMPCDSAAAELVALGAMIRDLGNSNANDIAGHYAALMRYARQYLEHCRGCDLPECDPAAKRCGYVAKATGRLRYSPSLRKVYTVSRSTDLANGRIALERPAGRTRSRSGEMNGPVTSWPNAEHATNWHIENEPPPQLASSEGALSEGPYRQIITEAEIHSNNLRRSYSGLCLVGRAGGEGATREICKSVRFQFSGGDYSLSDVLTIHRWSMAVPISRVIFYNARTEKFDRHTPQPSLVIADGDTSFLKVLGGTEFQRSDVIGVIHRVVERDRLEALGNQMLGLQQWYAEDTEMLGGLPAAPRAIGLSILKRRTP
ncbi:MAG: hypothetical protein EPO31_10955 [Gammaproteobacteria bacterium]|nr:MAG: hypothetical protein EPO31_10955 [Gammaproteobacteria bacterium]